MAIEWVTVSVTSFEPIGTRTNELLKNQRVNVGTSCHGAVSQPDVWIAVVEIGGQHPATPYCLRAALSRDHAVEGSNPSMVADLVEAFPSRDGTPRLTHAAAEGFVVWLTEFTSSLLMVGANVRMYFRIVCTASNRS